MANEYERMECQRILNVIDLYYELHVKYSARDLLFEPDWDEVLDAVREHVAKLQDHLGGPPGK